MALNERVITVLGGITKDESSRQADEAYAGGYTSGTEELSHRVSEAYASGYDDGGEDEPSSGDIAKYGYRRIMGDGRRDFSKISHERILEIVWSLWLSNPVADRHLEIKRDYILGRGVKPLADDEKLQEIVDNFWSVNKMSRRIKEFTLQLFLFGYQCYPVFVRESDGRVKMAYVDPAELENVVTHPDNAMEMWAVVVGAEEEATAWTKQRDRRVYRIVRQEERVGLNAKGESLRGKLVTAGQAVLEDWEKKMLEFYGLAEYTGTCFYEKINAVSNQSRGYSDLLQEADWLDQHDMTLFALADREQMAGYFSWFVTLIGADQAAVDKRSAKIRRRPPKKGSVNVTNENESWELKYPNLKQRGSIETATALLRFILGGLGWPECWYGKGDETNRATAQAQGDPTWRSLEHDQDVVRDLIVLMLEFARDQAEIAGTWTGEERGVSVRMPEMTTKDVQGVSRALQAIAAAMMMAQDMGWMTREKAAEVWAKVVSEIGVDVDSKKELAALAAGGGTMEAFYSQIGREA